MPGGAVEVKIDRRRIREFGKPLFTIPKSDRFQLLHVSWQGTDENPTDLAEATYTDRNQKRPAILPSIRTHLEETPLDSRVTSTSLLAAHAVSSIFNLEVPSLITNPSALRKALTKFNDELESVILENSLIQIDQMEVSCKMGEFRGFCIVDASYMGRSLTMIGPLSFIRQSLSSSTAKL
jgi:hypothetical protein